MLTKSQIQELDLKGANAYLKELNKLYNLELPLVQQTPEITRLADELATVVAYLDDHIRQLNFPSNQ